MEILPYVLLGVFILALGVRLVVQIVMHRGAEYATLEDRLRFGKVLNCVCVEADIMRRILSRDDARFIEGMGAPQVRKLFYSERKKLALRWVLRTQKQVSYLLKTHLMLAGHTSKPTHNFDFDLSAKYLVFKFISSVVLAIIWLVGPFKASIMITYIINSAEYFSSIFRLRHFDVQDSQLASRRSVQ
jgi:hypothetical protein